MTLPMMVTGLWSVILLFDLLRCPDRTRGRLVVFMITATVLYAGHGIFFARYAPLVVPADVVYTFCNLAVYPLYLLYIMQLTDDPAGRRREWILLLPAAVLTLAVAAVYVVMDEETTTAFVGNYLYRESSQAVVGLGMVQLVLHRMVHVLFALEVLLVLVLGVRKVARYDRKVASYYADTDDKSLRPLHHLLVAVAITCLLSFVANALGRHMFAHSLWLLAIPSALFSVLLFAIGYVGQRLRVRVEDTEVDAEVLLIPDVDDGMHTMTDNLPPDLLERLEAIMTDEQLYTQPNLRITDVAMRMGTNRQYVYLLLRNVMHLSFADYVNNRRVAHAVRLIKQSPDMLLTDVAVQSGFASTTSFYRNFKRVMGTTPTEYKAGV